MKTTRRAPLLLLASMTVFFVLEEAAVHYMPANAPLRALLKGLTSLCPALLCLLGARRSPSRLHIGLCLALLLCLVGDVAINLSMLAGIVFFAGAHVLLCAVYWRAMPAVRWQSALWAALSAAFIALAVLFRSRTGGLLPAVIAYILVQERLRAPSIEEAVYQAMERLEGAYSLVLSSPAKLIAVRDPYGFRPLCMGKTADGKVVFASESCALDAVGAVFERDLLPGEIVTVSSEGMTCDTRRVGKRQKSLCAFEFIYFSRPDSVLDGTAVSLARQKAGAFLAFEHPVEADVVIGVPDSGLDAALGYAAASGIPFSLGFTKNKYIGRTFIAPDQASRAAGVNIKLNPVRSEVAGRRIVLIDDSIVRGTTCRSMIALLRRAGAKEIHMRVSAPPFTAPCYYGTDVDDTASLIAAHHSVEEIASIIGVDSLGYLSVENLLKIAPASGPLCTACFGGRYPTPIPVNGEKNRFETNKIKKEKT